MAGRSSVSMGLTTFREKFVHQTSNVVHHFASHMAKGLQQMQKKLRHVDCIIEVHDARIPFSGRNPRFQDTLTLVRPHILVLNKMELADDKLQSTVKDKILSSGEVKRVLFTSCKLDTNAGLKQQLMSSVLELINSSDRHHRAESEENNVLIIGVPNVGKSSIINALRQTYLHKGGKATAVGALPGITRAVLEKIKVCERPAVYVYDTPGIMLPNIPNMDVGMKLALCATLRDHQVGVVTVADYMLYWLNKLKKFHYVQHYCLSEPVDDVTYFLTCVAQRRNLVLKVRSPAGGYSFRPNYEQAAAVVLRDFRLGLLGRITLDTDMVNDDRLYRDSVDYYRG